MPYSKVHNHPSCESGEWAVVKDDDGRLMSCHDSEGSADRQLAALHAAEQE